MKITFCVDRNKRFGDAYDDAPPRELVERYQEAVAAAFRERYPAHEILVEDRPRGAGDVEFAPEDALELRRVAHRLADTMLAEALTDRPRECG